MTTAAVLDVINERGPQVPRSLKNPIGQTERIRKTTAAVTQDLREVRDMVIEEFEAWPYEARNDFTSLQFYDFQVSQTLIDAIVERIRAMLIAGTGAGILRNFVGAAYREGVAKTVENLSGLGVDYPRTALLRLGDEAVLRRAALAGSRAFEQMRGFSGDVAADLARILFGAVQDGENPRQTARTIRERFRVSRSRAERIARTEITMAHRRGRWDEARDAEERFGITVRLLHSSALIAGRTRKSHAARHGRLFTREEQAAWYSRDGNAINCLCSATEVPVDDDGKPIAGKKLIERMAKRRKQFLAADVEPGST